MAKPTSGTLAAVMAGTPPLSASEVEPTKASTLGIRSCTSDALVEAFCWSSSTSSDELAPADAAGGVDGGEERLHGLGPLRERPGERPVIPLTLPNVMEVGVTPVSEAVFPAVPVQSPASDAGGEVEAARGG